MGHYGSEMEDRPTPENDHRAVREMGFKPVHVSHSRVSVVRCPACFGLVEAEYAVAHFGALHANRLATLSVEE